MLSPESNIIIPVLVTASIIVLVLTELSYREALDLLIPLLVLTAISLFAVSYILKENLDSLIYPLLFFIIISLFIIGYRPNISRQRLGNFTTLALIFIVFSAYAIIYMTGYIIGNLLPVIMFITTLLLVLVLCLLNPKLNNIMLRGMILFTLFFIEVSYVIYTGQISFESPHTAKQQTMKQKVREINIEIREVEQSKNWAETGNVDSQYFLGVKYEHGYSEHGNIIVEQDRQKALYYYEQAAKQGHEGAEWRVGLMYKDGVQGYHKAFIPADAQKAIYWLEKYAKRDGPPKTYYETIPLLGGNYYDRGDAYFTDRKSVV